MLWLAVLASDRLIHRATVPLLHRSCIFAPVTLVAGGYEVLGLASTADRKSVNVIDHRTEKIEQRRIGPRPTEMMVGKRTRMSRLSEFAFKKLHGRREDHWPLAPTA